MLSKNIAQMPDAYRKSEDGNNNKMLLLTEMANEDFSDDLQDVDSANDLDSAYGKTLDLYGNIYGVRRGTLNDEQLRMAIRAKVASNASAGDVNSVLRMVAAAFNTDLTNVGLQETDVSCNIKLEKLPLDALINAELSAEQAVEIATEILPVATKVTAGDFVGTFTFSGASNDYDESAGFSNESQTTGGFFGMIYGADPFYVKPPEYSVMVIVDEHGNVYSDENGMAFAVPILKGE